MLYQAPSPPKNPRSNLVIVSQPSNQIYHFFHSQPSYGMRYQAPSPAKNPRSNLVIVSQPSNISFLPFSAQLLNALPGTNTGNQNRQSFKRDVNHYLGSNLSASPCRYFRFLQLAVTKNNPHSIDGRSPTMPHCQAPLTSRAKSPPVHAYVNLLINHVILSAIFGTAS